MNSRTYRNIKNSSEDKKLELQKMVKEARRNRYMRLQEV